VGGEEALKAVAVEAALQRTPAQVDGGEADRQEQPVKRGADRGARGPRARSYVRPPPGRPYNPDPDGIDPDLSRLGRCVRQRRPLADVHAPRERRPALAAGPAGPPPTV